MRFHLNASLPIPQPVQSSRRRWLPWVLSAAAAVIPLLFALYTSHVWEDFYITFRSSKNLVAGNGLVYQLGERVHSFTSPLGVLVPAACSWLTATDGGAIWLFRLVSAGLLAVTALLLWRFARRLRLVTLATTLLFGLFLLDAKIADFAANGMETAFVLFFLIWTLDALLSGPPRPWSLGLGLAGLMWTRPDGFVFGGTLLAGFVIFAWRHQPVASRKATARWLARSALLGFALYLPWLLWAWVYYGSPIPHTIAAKSAIMTPNHVLETLGAYPFQLLMGQAAVTRIFMPSYYFLGGWPSELLAFSLVLTLPAVFYFLVPRADPIGRSLSFALFVGGAYLQIAPPFPWYEQVWQALAILVLAIMVADATRLFSWLTANHRVATGHASALRISVAVLIAVQGAILLCSATQLRINQNEIEFGVRRTVGLWLKANARPGDRVFLEPLGYIGYFSGLKMLDVPGLAAPEVTATIRAGATSWPDMITRLQPDWLVLRPGEAQRIAAADPNLLRATFRPVRTFDARSRLALHDFFPGAGYAAYDAVFTVYHRNAPPQS